MDTKTKFTEMIPEQRVLLNNINWQLLERLLNARKDNNISKISYCQGRLEFMSPFSGHEIINKRIENMIWILADELTIHIGKAGQGQKVIFKKENMDIAKEPDSCYYAHQNAPQAKDKINVDLSDDIPPNLAIEIDQTKSFLNQLEIYASLGVPEVWIYKNDNIKFYQLQKKRYINRERSFIFPILPESKVIDFLSEFEELGEKQAIENLRSWSRNYII